MCWVYMCGQPCVPTAPCTESGLDSMAGLWLTVAWRMQPWKAWSPAGRPGTVTLSGGHGEEQHVRETEGTGCCLSTSDCAPSKALVHCRTQGSSCVPLRGGS